MSYYDIGQSIKACLDIVQAAVGSRLSVVYDFEAPDATGYPYATIAPKEGEEDILDTANNLATYRFLIRAVNVNKDKGVMEPTMRRLADDIMGELRKGAHQTFGNTVDRVSPFKISWGWETSNNLPSRFFEIEIEVMKDIPIL